jgi:hypothetical protein
MLANINRIGLGPFIEPSFIGAVGREAEISAVRLGKKKIYFFKKIFFTPFSFLLNVCVRLIPFP